MAHFNDFLPPTAVYVRSLSEEEQQEIRESGLKGDFSHAIFETNGARCFDIYGSLESARITARQEGMEPLLVH